MAAKYKVTSPGYKTAHFQSFMGAYERVVAMILRDQEVAQATSEAAYQDGVAIWERQPDGSWRYDYINTAEAWRESCG